MKTITWEDKGCCLVFEGVDKDSPSAKFEVMKPPYDDYDFSLALNTDAVKERINSTDVAIYNVIKSNRVADNAIIKAMTLN